MDGITNDGVFEDSFRTDILPGAIGDEHKGTKLFDDVPDVQTLCKRFADTKASHDKKLENIIQKPADDATEEVKTAYRTELATASGAPDTAAGYEFFKPEKLPEGMEYDTAVEDKYRAFFAEHKVPKVTAMALSKIFAETAISNFETLIETDRQAAATKADEEQKAFDEGCTSLKTAWPGDKLATNARISLAAINKFGNEELIKNLKEAKMYENAADLAAWKKAGVSLDTLQLFHKVALETLDANALGGEAGSRDGTPSISEKARKMYPNTKD